MFLLCRTGQDNTHIDLHVRHHKVLDALQWLHSNNTFYANITIDHVALQALPCDAIPPELRTIEGKQDSTVEECQSSSGTT